MEVNYISITVIYNLFARKLCQLIGVTQYSTAAMMV